MLPAPSNRSSWLGRDLPGLAAMVVYGTLCFTLSPEFPFARIDMYADVGHRYEGAMPMFTSNGRPVDLRSMTDFRGLGPADIGRDGMPCSEEYLLDEMRNYVAAHQAPADASPSEQVPVDFAWRRYHMEEDGTVVDDEVVVMASGTARVQR